VELLVLTPSSMSFFMLLFITTEKNELLKNHSCKRKILNLKMAPEVFHKLYVESQASEQALITLVNR
jgi:hypothetical protein